MRQALFGWRHRIRIFRCDERGREIFRRIRCFYELSRRRSERNVQLLTGLEAVRRGLLQHTERTRLLIEFGSRRCVVKDTRRSTGISIGERRLPLTARRSSTGRCRGVRRGFIWTQTNPNAAFQIRRFDRLVRRQIRRLGRSVWNRQCFGELLLLVAKHFSRWISWDRGYFGWWRWRMFSVVVIIMERWMSRRSQFIVRQVDTIAANEST